jgi:hypothetical protein
VLPEESTAVTPRAEMQTIRQSVGINHALCSGLTATQRVRSAEALSGVSCARTLLGALSDATITAPRVSIKIGNSNMTWPYYAIEEWWGEPFDGHLARRITQAPWNQLEAFLADVSLANREPLLPILKPGNVRPLVTMSPIDRMWRGYTNRSDLSSTIRSWPCPRVPVHTVRSTAGPVTGLATDRASDGPPKQSSKLVLAKREADAK